MTSGTTEVAGEPHPTEPGELIRYWREARGLTQMELAFEADVSARHMSFVETGRSGASRELILRIAEALDIPLREQNAILEAAGFARRYRESPLSHPDLARARRVLRFLLDRHEPFSALVFDAGWEIVMVNEAHRRIADFFLGGAEPPARVRDNLLRLTLHPDGLRDCLVNRDEVEAVLLERVRREVAEAPSNRALAGLLDETRGYGTEAARRPERPGEARGEDEGGRVLLPIHLRRGGVDLRLVSVLSTLGTAVDVTLAELRLETFFPADEASEEALVELAC